MTSCPLCPEGHDPIVELLAEGPKHELRRIPSDALLVEQEYIRRELVAVDIDGEAGPTALWRHRLQVSDREIGRRRRLAKHGAPNVPTASRISPDTIREIKELTDLADLVGEDCEMAWYRAGRAYFRCKLHGDGVDVHPSLTVYEDRQHWVCWVCGDRGDAYDWLIKARGMEWIEAVRYLAGRRHVDLAPKPTAGLVGTAL